MLSADISGFTALSEKLAGKGKAGAEEITSLINTCFTALIESAYQYGGEVIKFGGDALLILFRSDNHERRAADAGLLMQRALHSSPAAKRANLTMTVGVPQQARSTCSSSGPATASCLITGPRATRGDPPRRRSREGRHARRSVDRRTSPERHEAARGARRLGDHRLDRRRTERTR